MWLKRFSADNRFCFRITADTFIVDMTGSSIIIRDRNTNKILKKHSRHNYLYTGDISSDETECFALENGKHFYVYSLKTFELIKRVMLPKYYESIDLCGHYSEGEKFIVIPAHRWCNGKNCDDGHNEYVLCRYETVQHTLIDKTVIDNLNSYVWDDEHLWEPIQAKSRKRSTRTYLRF